MIFDDYTEVLDEDTRVALAGYRPESPHNVYVGIAAGTGFGALAFYFAANVLMFRSLIKGCSRSSGRGQALLLVGIGAALAGQLATDFLMTPDIAGSWLFWVLAGAGVGTAEGLSASAGNLAPQPQGPPHHPP